MPEWGPAIRERLASVRLAPPHEAEIVEELSLHLDDRVHEMIAGGTDAETAETIALAELRASDLLPRYLATLGRARWIDPSPPAAARPFSWTGFTSDVRHSLRRLAKSPGYALLAVLTLSLGIGANAATLAMANWLVFRPIPGVHDPATLVTIRLSTEDQSARSPLSPFDLDTIREHVPALSSLAGYMDLGNFLAVTAGLRHEKPVRVNAETVTANYFAVLGVPIRLGRGFTDEEGTNSTAPPVAVVSDALFRSALHGDTALVGRPFVVNGREVTLAGVAAPAFAGTNRGFRVDLWLTAAQRRVVTPSNTTSSFFSLVGRRTGNVPPRTVQNQLRSAEGALIDANPATTRFSTRHFVALNGLVPINTDEAALRGTFVLLLAFSSLLFLLACANVSNANLARVSVRRGEIATRLALGASRWLVARMLFVDSLVPAMLAGAAALAVAYTASVLLTGTPVLINGAPLPRVPLDWRVLTLGLALAMAAAVGSGLWPTFAGTRTSVVAAMRASGSAYGSGRHRLSFMLTVLQVALSFILVVGAVLFGRSMAARLAVPSGFADDHVLTLQIDPLALTGRDTSRVYRDLVAQLRDVPGARAAARAFLPPFYSGMESRLALRPPGDTANLVVGLNYVDPGFFDAMGLPFVAGRDFTTAERNGTGPAKATPLIIGEWLARRLFGDRPAAGEYLTQYDGTTRLIVGVVRDARHRKLLDDNSAEMAFQPFQDNMHPPLVTFVVGLSRPAADAWPDVQRAIARVDPTLPVFNVMTAYDGIRAQFSSERLILRLTSVFGATALLLAAVGLYGVLTRRLAERQRELGIRSALGASRAALAALVARETARVLVLGLIGGALAAAWLTRFIQSQLYGVSRVDAAAFAAAAVCVALVMIVATAPASRRAGHIDPVKTLKES
jgi:predicted permease